MDDSTVAALDVIDRSLREAYGDIDLAADTSVRADLARTAANAGELVLEVAALASRWRHRSFAPLLTFADPLDRGGFEAAEIDDRTIAGEPLLTAAGGALDQLLPFAAYADGSMLVAVPVAIPDEPVRVVMIDPSTEAFWHRAPDGSGAPPHATVVTDLPTLDEFVRVLAAAHRGGRFTLDELGQFDVDASRDEIGVRRSYPWEARGQRRGIETPAPSRCP